MTCWLWISNRSNNWFSSGLKYAMPIYLVLWHKHKKQWTMLEPMSTNALTNIYNVVLPTFTDTDDTLSSNHGTHAANTDYICVGLYSWVCKHVQQWASTVPIHPAGGRTHSDYKMEWQTIKSVWVSTRVRSQLGAEWHRSLPLSNHSLARTQRSSHTTWTIFRQVSSFGFSFAVFTKYFPAYREIKVGHSFS